MKHRLQILKCAGCDAPTFREELFDSADWDENPVTGERFNWGTVKIYPARDTRSEMQYSFSLPPEILKIYREVLIAIGANVPILAAIGLRALVETACRHLGAMGNLEQKIEELVEKSVIRKEEAKILHSLRKTGNESAHETRAFAHVQLIDAVTMVEHILTNVYLLPLRLGDLPKGISKEKRGNDGV